MRTLVIAGLALACGGNPKPAPTPPPPTRAAPIEVLRPGAVGSASDVGGGSAAAGGGDDDRAQMQVALAGGGDPCGGGPIAAEGDGGLGGVRGGPGPSEGIGEGPLGHAHLGGSGRIGGPMTIRGFVRMGELTVTGQLTKEMVKRVLMGHVALYRACYERELLRNPGIRGKVVAKLVVDGQGAVTSATVKALDTSVDACLVRQLRLLRFPHPAAGTVQIVAPFVFSAELP